MNFPKWLAKIVLILLSILSIPVFANSQCVILLHGITRTHYSMMPMEIYLKKYNYIVVNRDYPSTSKHIIDLAEENIGPMINECLTKKATKIHFVTHSMGGILLQVYLQYHDIAKLGHIVMLSPPNHGSDIADLLVRNPLYQLITGPAGQELTTYKTSTPNQLQLKPQYSVGVLTGTFNFVPFGNFLFKGPNDGAVAVASAQTTIMRDFMTIPVSHCFIMDNPFVQFQVIRFLNFGKFARIKYISKKKTATKIALIHKKERLSTQ